MRWVLLLAALVAGCSKGPEADLQYIKEARSLGAEWALVNELASDNKLTRSYVSTMRAWIRKDMQTASEALAQPDSRYGQEIQALLAQPDDPPPEELRAHAEKLKQIEDSLESA